jgi:hypothetical protein
VIPVSDHHGNGTAGGCCGSCQHAHRPRVVIGIFTDAAGARGVADMLRDRGAGAVNLLSSGLPMLAQDLSALPDLGCGRLMQQISHHLETGASIVIVDVQSPEHQLGISRVLLDSKCDLLLTQDSTRHVD